MKAASTTYTGEWIRNAPVVKVDGQVLTHLPSLKVHQHALQFGWGSADANGPTQLAVALLWDFTADTQLTVKRYMRFLHEVIAQLPREWSLTGAQICDWLQRVANSGDYPEPPRDPLTRPIVLPALRAPLHVGETAGQLQVDLDADGDVVGFRFVHLEGTAEAFALTATRLANRARAEAMSEAGTPAEREAVARVQLRTAWDGSIRRRA